MPEQQVKTYTRNGRVVRAYRRRGRAGRGTQPPAPKVRPGRYEDWEMSTPIPSAREIQSALGPAALRYLREHPDELKGTFGGNPRRVAASIGEDFADAMKQIVDMVGKLNANAVNRTKVPEAELRQRHAEAQLILNVVNKLAAGANPFNNTQRNTVNRMLDATRRLLIALEKQAKRQGTNLKDRRTRREVSAFMKKNPIAAQNDVADAKVAVKRAVGKAVDVVNPFD